MGCFPICQWDRSRLPDQCAIWDNSHMEDDGPLAKNVRIWMDFRDIGQKALSLKAGLNETYVRDILKGRSRNPTQSRLAKLAGALDCSVEDLTGAVSESGRDDPDRRTILITYDSGDPLARAMLIRVAKSFQTTASPTETPPETPAPSPPHRPAKPPPRPQVGGSVGENEDVASCVKAERWPRVPV